MALLITPVTALYAEDDCTVVEKMAANIMRERQQGIPQSYFERYIEEEIKGGYRKELYQVMMQDAYSETVKATDLEQKQAINKFGEKYKMLCELSEAK